MVKTIARQSDDVRAAASAAMQDAAKTMQDPATHGDLKTAAGALVDVIIASSGSLQNPAARRKAKQTAAVLIDHLATRLGSPGVQDGSVDPAAALRVADSPAKATNLLGGALKNQRIALKGRQALDDLRRLLSPSTSGDGQQSALADGLRSLGQMLDSPQRRGTVKTAVNICQRATATVSFPPWMTCRFGSDGNAAGNYRPGRNEDVNTDSMAIHRHRASRPGGPAAAAARLSAGHRAA
jgi:hypothetical protein